MLNRLENAADNFDSLSMRLRILITLALISVIFMIFDLIWFSDLQQGIKINNNEIVAIKNQQQIILVKQQRLNSNIVKVKRNPKKHQLNQINLKIESIENNLSELVTNLIKPGQMVSILSSIIKSSDNLLLVKFSKLKTTELSQPAVQQNNNSEIESNSNSNQVRLFQHKIEIKLVGKFNNSYQFLKELEKTESKMSFDEFKYQVKQYPTAEITLIVSTLSLQREWIGG